MASEEQNDEQQLNLLIRGENKSINESTQDCVKDDDYSEPIYIKVAEDEDDEAVELPCERDNSILLSTLSSQFPNVSGLKYRNPDTNAMRGLRLVNGKFIAPEKGWKAFSPYFCVFPRGKIFKSQIDFYNYYD